MLLWLEKLPEKLMKQIDKKDKLILLLIEDKMLDYLKRKDKNLKIEKLLRELGSNLS